MPRRGRPPGTGAVGAMVAATLAGALALVPVASRAAGCHLAKVADLPVTVADGIPTTPARVNGRAVQALVSTGGAMTLFSERGAEALGLRGVATEDRMLNGNGLWQLWVVPVDQLDVGPLQVRHAHLGVVRGDGDRMPLTLGAPFFFHDHETELALGEGRITMFRADDCARASLSYWDRDAQVLPLHPDPDAGDVPFVDVEVDGHTLRASVSTGSRATLIDARVARDLGLPAVEGRPGTVRLHRFALGGEAIEDAILRVADLNERERTDLRRSTRALRSPSDMDWREMVLGLDFLMAHRVLVSSSQQRVYVSYVSGRPFHPDGDVADVSPTFADGVPRPAAPAASGAAR